MIESLKARIWIVFGVLVFGAYIFSPNFFSDENRPGWLPSQSLVYGLDIQGGLHLVLGVDTKGVLEEKIARLGGALKEDINKDNAGAVTSIQINEVEPYNSVTLKGNVKKISKYIGDTYPGTLQYLAETEETVTYQYYETYVNQIKKQIVVQAIEVIRNRIDSFGVAEPYIAAQGSDRIIVQLPGINEADYEQAKDLINRAARLEFMIVSNEVSPVELNSMVSEIETAGGYTLGSQKEGGLKYLDYVKRINKDLQGKLPDQTEVVFQKLDQVTSIEDGKTPVLVKNSQVFTGDKISDAFVGMGDYGEPLVNFSVASDGRNEFAKMTGENVDKPMAIILDKVLKSAPNIQARLREGGVITLGTGQEVAQEAEFLTNTLRAGALPAALEQLEERSVGPTLGADSVEAGKKAGLVGLIIVLFFMISWYRAAGLVASLALVTNIFLLLALLTSLGATLTLPGIAGIVLTVGMAVDANVIIFERIREEILKGSGIKAAVKDGFGHALSAILDANITTAGVCLVLMFYGTGPIKGFAVTLIWGIVTSMFTAIFLSRVIIDVLVRMGFQKLMPAKKKMA
jgi:preprotein translocase subunit SecD